MRVLAGATVLVTTAVVPVAAQEAAPTAIPAVDPVPVPTSTTLADTPTAPVTPEAATVTVDDEASHRAALTSLSTAPSGPHTIELAADIVVHDGTDPTYTGDADLAIDGNGHLLDGADVNRLLVVESADADLTLGAVAVQGGRAVGDGGAVWSSGGAQVSVAGASFADNHATGNGGAIAGDGNVVSEESTFAGNVARRGGAVSTAGSRPSSTTPSPGTRPPNAAADFGRRVDSG